MLWILRKLWGDLSETELKKFGVLGVMLTLVIGNYWMLRITKDGLFAQLVGYREWQPVAKWLSIIVVIVAVLGYSKLLDIFSKSKLIYIFCLFYGFSFIALSYFISNPSLIAVSESSALYPLVSWIPSRVPGGGIGWFAYALLESYGSLLIALFYSFIASVMTTSSAKKGYGMLAAITQLGTVGGSVFTGMYVQKLGIPMLYTIGGCIILIAPLIATYYIVKFPQEGVPVVEGKSAAAKTGFFEGLRLMISHPYVMGVFVVVTFYEIMSTIIEYQMGWLAAGYYTPEGIAVYKSYQAVGINVLALVFALLGTSFFMRRFGFKFCLTAFPLLIAVVMVSMFLFWFFGVDNFYLMYLLLGASILIKGLNYALNKPTGEVMYIPTSKDVKFKTKGWIDSFGNRSTKGMGSAVSKSFGHSFSELMLYGTILSLGIIGVWFLVARFVGNRFNKLQETNTIIE